MAEHESSKLVTPTIGKQIIHICLTAITTGAIIGFLGAIFGLFRYSGPAHANEIDFFLFCLGITGLLVTAIRIIIGLQSESLTKLLIVGAGTGILGAVTTYACFILLIGIFAIVGLIAQ